MAKHCIALLVILSSLHFSLQDSRDNEVDTEDVNPFAEAASAILKEQNAQNIGSMINGFMQSGGAAKIGDALSKLGSENAGKLLEGLGSLVGSKDKDGGGEGDSAANLLEGLGSLMGSLQGAGAGGGDNAAGSILQGLGSLLGGQAARGGQGGIDPAMIGSLINMFASKKSSKSPRKKTSAKQDNQKMKTEDKVEPKSDSDIDMGDLLSLAGSFLSKNEGESPAGNLLSFLPMIMQTVSAFTGSEAQKRADSHSDHSSMLPPFLERIHVAFDNFIHSDMGKYVLSVMGAEKAFKVFTDENGRFNYPKFVEMMENRSFRRHWIRMVTDRVADMLLVASNPKTQKAYLFNTQYFINSFLKAQGFPKSTLFDPARPTETISALVNHLAKKYFDLRIYSKEYVKSAVAYVQDLLQLTQKSGSRGGGTKELSDKLADTVNLEIIEPIARVNRAYRFATSVPSCDRYVLCLVNEENANEQETLPGLKKLLYKGASLLAGWFLSGETGTSFWTLYSDITDNTNCKALYSEKCHDFHLEEIKVTTEYVHNEL